MLWQQKNEEPEGALIDFKKLYQSIAEPCPIYSSVPYTVYHTSHPHFRTSA